MEYPNMRNLLFFVLLLSSLASCRKAEEPYEALLRETINLNDLHASRLDVADIGNNYGLQIFYSLEHHEIVAIRDKYSWDFAIRNSGAPSLVLNSSVVNLRIAYAGEDWDSVPNLDELEWMYDLPDRQDASLAVGENLAGVFVIQRGLTNEGVERGFRKVKLEAGADSLQVRVADLNGSNEAVYSIVRDEGVSLSCFSLDNGWVEVEPRKEEWDLLFTSYLHVYDPESNPFPYQVSGVLLNPFRVQAALCEPVNYADFVPQAEHVASLSSDANSIGFDWKYFDFDAGYLIVPDRSYLIHGVDERQYLLQFTGFYDEEGLPGSMAFQYRLLP